MIRTDEFASCRVDWPTKSMVTMASTLLYGLWRRKSSRIAPYQAKLGLDLDVSYSRLLSHSLALASVVGRYVCGTCASDWEEFPFISGCLLASCLSVLKGIVPSCTQMALRRAGQRAPGVDWLILLVGILMRLGGICLEGRRCTLATNVSKW